MHLKLFNTKHTFPIFGFPPSVACLRRFRDRPPSSARPAPARRRSAAYRMGKRVLTPEFIAFMSVLYLFQSPGGLADISNGFWWFIIPALSAQFISTAVNIVEMSVGPTTWKKVEGHANKATSVANFFELIAVFEMSMMATSDSFWGRLFINCVWIGMIGLILVDRVVCMAKGGSTYQVEKNGLSVQ